MDPWLRPPGAAPDPVHVITLAPEAAAALCSVAASLGMDAARIDLDGCVAILTDHGPMALGAATARERIQLVTLGNDWSLRNLIPLELAKGFGFYQSKPATSFSPVAVTPDELGDAFSDGAAAEPRDAVFGDHVVDEAAVQG